MTSAIEQRSRANAGLATGSHAAIQWQDEISALGTAGTVTDVDFTGAGVTALTHTHPVGTLATVAEASHTHAVGTLASSASRAATA